MNLVHAVLLGIAQGATEFLPVSSSGHLAVAQHYLAGFSQPGVLFDVLLHVGTLGAVVLYFRSDVARLCLAPFRRGAQFHEDRRLFRLIVVASLPTAVIGLTFKDSVEALFADMTVVGLMLLLTGTLVFFGERFRRPGRNLAGLRVGDALAAGIAQGCAILPGLSRSGSTIAVLLFKGVDGESAARFSFLMGLPAIAGAALLSLRHLDEVAGSDVPAYLAGMAVAFLVGLCAIRLLLAVIRRGRLAWFAVYCWCFGALLLALNH